MPWIVITVTCILFWGFTGILYKKSSEYSDPLSHFKCLVWIGIVMGIAGTIMLFCSDTIGESIVALKDNLYLIPVALLYPIALFFGLIGNRHLDASVISPLENIDGAIAAVILYFYFLFTKNTEVTSSVTTLDMVAVGLTILGVVALGIQEQKLSKTEEGVLEHKKRHRLGAIAIIFPLIYNLVDALSMVATGITVSEATSSGISDIDFFIFESLGFVFVGLFFWLYMIITKKYVYNPFKKTEISKCGAAIGETGGTMLFIFAVALNPILTAPIVASYCLVTIFLARIFLKEKLTKKQYLCLALLLAGIILLSISEILK